MPSSFPHPADIRFCPRCSHELEARTLEDRERPVCPDCGYIFYLNPKVAAGALVEMDGQVLLIKRGVEPNRGYWALPAGFAELDESIEETARREVREETGLEVELDDLLGVYSFQWPGRGVLILYSAHPVGGELRPGYDAQEARFFAPAELPRQIAFRTHGQALLDWRRARGLLYRPARPQDLAAAGRLAGEHDYRAGDLARAWRVLVALDGDHLVGFCGLYPQDGQARLRHLFVHPRYRRWGVGTRLIDEAAHEASQAGEKALTSEVESDSVALVVFLRAGFAVEEGGGERVRLVRRLPSQ